MSSPFYAINDILKCLFSLVRMLQKSEQRRGFFVCINTITQQSDVASESQHLASPLAQETISCIRTKKKKLQGVIQHQILGCIESKEVANEELFLFPLVFSRAYKVVEKKRARKKTTKEKLRDIPGMRSAEGEASSERYTPREVWKPRLRDNWPIRVYRLPIIQRRRDCPSLRS